MKYIKSFNLIENFFYIIFLTLPLSFIIGSAPVNILTFFSSIGLFIFSSKENNWIWIKNKIFILFSIYILYIFFTYIITNYQNLSVSKLFNILGFFRFVFTAFFIAIIFHITSEKKKSFFIKFNFFIICFVLIDILIQKIFGKDIFGFTGGMCFGNNFTYFDFNSLKEIRVQNSTYCQRFAGPFDQEFIAGSFIAFIGTIIFALKFLTEPFKNKNLIYFFSSLIFSFIIILITGDRSPLISFLIALLFFFIFEKNTRKYFIRLSLTFFFAGLVTIFMNIHVYERYVSVGKALLDIDQPKKEKLMDTVNNEKNVKKPNSNQSSSVKLIQTFYDTHWGAHYLAAIEMFKEKPLIGHGYKSFRNICKKYDYINSKSVNNRCSTHPHNYVLQLLAETGIIGFLLFCLFLISTLLRAIKYRTIENKALFIFLFGVFISFLFPIKPGGSIFSTMNSFYMFYILGWVLYSSNYNDIRNLKK